MESHPGKPPRLDRFFVDRPLFFITFNTQNRHAVLACQTVHDHFRLDCQRGIEMGAVEVGRFVIMPDHIHLFVRGNDDFDPGLWIRGLKRALSKVLPENIDLWQPGFFDHVLRSDESYAEKWEYVRMNPVRKGLVSDPDQWPWAGELVYLERT